MSILQQILDHVLGTLEESSDELDEGHNPVEILQKKFGMRKLTAQQALGELHEQGKIGLMRGSKNEIVAVFIHTEEEEPERSRLFTPGKCIVLIDVENIRIQMELRRNVFPGDAILEYLQKMKFQVITAYAFMNDKAPSGEVLHQHKLLSEQGFTPIICYDIKNNAGDAVDWEMAEAIRSLLGNPGIQAFVVISGDRDFEWIRGIVMKNGHEFFVISPINNISDEWRNKSKALPLVLNETEQDALVFLQGVLADLGRSNPPQIETDDEKKAFAFLVSLVSGIENLKRGSINNFQDVCRILRKSLTDDIKGLYSKEFAYALVSIITDHTDLIKRHQLVTYHGNDRSQFQRYFRR